jgi:lycopene cyclase domain-containing protein
MSERWTYCLHLGWALPVLALQLGCLRLRYGRAAWRLLRRIVPPVLAVTAWLVAADGIAIRAGIWRFGEATRLGIDLVGIPLEEVLFFYLSNTLVAVGLLLLDGFGRRRPA